MACNMPFAALFGCYALGCHIVTTGPACLAEPLAGKAARTVELDKEEMMLIKSLGLITLKVEGKEGKGRVA
eukprot:1158880-Pelagomonas_calceolata.AAC.5